MLKKSFTVISSLCLMSITSIAEAHVNLNIDLSVSPPPPAPTTVVMGPPEGYSNCYMTPGAWMGNVWVPPHQECVYQQPTGPSIWVSGYWGCVSVGPEGSCGHWRWFGHRWARGHEMGYNDHYGYHEFHHHRHW